MILKLPSDNVCDLPILTRRRAGVACTCRWCNLARLSGGTFVSWKASLKKEDQSVVTHICKDCGRGVKVGVIKHKCNVSDQAMVRALLESIPKEVKAKQAQALIQEQHQEQSSSSTVSLPQYEGGHAMKITVNPASCVQRLPLSPLSLKEVQVMSNKAHLTGAQQESIMADLRSKWGRKIVEPGLQLALPIHNRKFANFFSVEKKSFMNSDGTLSEKFLFFCHSPEKFLREVDRERGRHGHRQVTLVQGDSRQGYTKLAVSRLSIVELEQEEYTRIPGAGMVYLETEEEVLQKKRKRRSREEGIKGGEQFEDCGARKLLVLAVVYKVPENDYNLETIFKASNIHQLDFKMTGDFAFLMPCLGLLKGCSSSNPCPVCNQERSKEGGDGARWVEGKVVNLRSFGTLHSNFDSWAMEGERPEAAQTRKWKSVTGPVLVMVTAMIPWSWTR